MRPRGESARGREEHPPGGRPRRESGAQRPLVAGARGGTSGDPGGDCGRQWERAGQGRRVQGLGAPGSPRRAGGGRQGDEVRPGSPPCLWDGGVPENALSGCVCSEGLRAPRPSGNAAHPVPDAGTPPALLRSPVHLTAPAGCRGGDKLSLLKVAPAPGPRGRR